MNTPANVTISAAPGSTPGVCNIDFQVVDAAGAPVSGVYHLFVWLSDMPTGEKVADATPAGGVSRAGGSGYEVHHKMNQRAFDVLTGVDGRYVLMITDQARRAYYPAAAVPGSGRVVVGPRLLPGAYR